MPFIGNRNGLHDGHIGPSPTPVPHLGRKPGQVVILEFNLSGVNQITHAPVAHVRAAPSYEAGLGQQAIYGIAGGGAGEQVDLEAPFSFGAPHQGLGDQLGIAGRKS